MFQYKDAFFSANPDFKWYKLPAPPLRTLCSRPRETADKMESPDSDYHDSESEKTNNNSTKHDYNKKPSDEHPEPDAKPLSMFTPGKLADEAQMGGLSSLLATKTEVQTPNPYYSPHTYKFAISAPIEYRSHNLLHAQKPTREHSISELQNALSETTKMFEKDFEEKRLYYGDQFTNQDVIDQIVDKRYSNEECMKNWSDDEKNRSGRSCKGKRYQEFMAVGGLIVNKRQRRDCPERLSDEGYDASCSCDPGSSREESTVTDDSKTNVDTSEIETKMESTDAPEPDNNGNRTFKAADFDLDAKIRALPSLSLEKFQQRKRENKRKKKAVHAKPKAMEPQNSQIINSVPRSLADERREMAESWRETVIGSQKRKPRKISITRLEINSMVSSRDMNGGHKISPDIKIATEAPCTVVQSMDMCTRTHGNDLLALATLAEVASNTSRIEEVQETTAKASADYASKVSNTTY